MKIAHPYTHHMLIQSIWRIFVHRSFNHLAIQTINYHASVVPSFFPVALLITKKKSNIDSATENKDNMKLMATSISQIGIDINGIWTLMLFEKIWLLYMVWTTEGRPCANLCSDCVKPKHRNKSNGSIALDVRLLQCAYTVCRRQHIPEIFRFQLRHAHTGQS